MNVFDVRIYAIRRRKDRRRPFEVRWRAAGKGKSRSFITRGLADSYRAELVRAARQGLEFDPATGEPTLWAIRQPPAVSWYQHAVAYATMKWPHLAPHSRASLADALATVTPAFTQPATRRPPARALRAALYGHAFNPHRQPTSTDPAAARTLAWLERASLPRQPAQRPTGDPRRAGRPDQATRRHPSRTGHHRPQARYCTARSATQSSSACSQPTRCPR